MNFICLRLIALFFICVSFSTALNAKPAQSVDKFIADMQATVSGTQPFMQFARLIDPLTKNRSAAETIRDFLRKEFRGKKPKFDVIYRRQDADVAVTLIAVIWAETNYAYLAVLLHQRPDGWLPVSYSLQGSYEKVLKYR